MRGFAGRVHARFANRPTLESLVDFVAQYTNSTPRCSAADVRLDASLSAEAARQHQAPRFLRKAFQVHCILGAAIGMVCVCAAPVHAVLGSPGPWRASAVAGGLRRSAEVVGG